MTNHPSDAACGDLPESLPDMAQLMAQFHAREAALKAFRPLDISFRPEVRNLVQTSLLHPSSWEGWTTGGAFIYVRFRHGRLWIGLAPDRGIAPTMLFVARHPGE